MTPSSANLYNSTPNFKARWGIDSPTGFVSIAGVVWVIFNPGNQYGTTVKVARFKGSDFEHTERQLDGVIEVQEQGVSTHFLRRDVVRCLGAETVCTIHCEYDRGISPPAGWSRKKTRLATSTDKGLTWHLEGDILTSCLPEKGDWLKFSGPNFEVGPGDFDFYVDERSGYFYIFICNALAPKNGRMNNFLWFHEVARCAISDKMAPGKWHKFCNGRLPVSTPPMNSAIRKTAVRNSAMASPLPPGRLRGPSIVCSSVPLKRASCTSPSANQSARTVTSCPKASHTVNVTCTDG